MHRVPHRDNCACWGSVGLASSMCSQRNAHNAACITRPSFQCSGCSVEVKDYRAPAWAQAATVAVCALCGASIAAALGSWLGDPSWSISTGAMCVQSRHCTRNMETMRMGMVLVTGQHGCLLCVGMCRGRRQPAPRHPCPRSSSSSSYWDGTWQPLQWKLVQNPCTDVRG